MDKITQIMENVLRCKYVEAGVHIKNPIKNSYEDGLGRTTQTLDHVVVVHILIWDKRKSQINEYSDCCVKSNQCKSENMMKNDPKHNTHIPSRIWSRVVIRIWAASKQHGFAGECQVQEGEATSY